MKDINNLTNYQMKDIIDMIGFSHNLICLTNIEGKLLYVNESWMKILGRSKEELLDIDLLSLIHVNDIEKTKIALQNATHSYIEDFENRYYHKNGSIRYIKWTTKPIEKEGIIVAIGCDITHEKTFFHHMNSFYNALTDTAIVSVTDVKGKILEVNEDFCKISGYTEAELLGQDHRLLNSKMHSPEFFKELWDTILSNKTWRGQVCNMKKDGSFYWVDSFVLALRDLNGDIEKFISVRYDITDIKESESHMMQTSLLASLGEISASIVHEINNPLSIIKFASEDLTLAISKEVLIKEDIEDSANYIQNAISRISTIIKGLQAYSRHSDNACFEEQDFDKIVEETLLFSQYRFKDTGVEFHLGEMVDATVHAIPSQISQILVNLFNNAIDATIKTPKSWVELSSRIQNGKLLIYVTDNGHGIPDDIIHKIMNPFFTTKSASKGTGIGLNLSRKMAKQHGGDLRYDKTSPNTRFILELPVLEKKSDLRAI